MTSANVHCTFCGDETSWGRFGSGKALYMAAGGYKGYERVAWICRNCQIAFGLVDAPPHWTSDDAYDNSYEKKLLKALHQRVKQFRDSRP